MRGRPDEGDAVRPPLLRYLGVPGTAGSTRAAAESARRSRVQVCMDRFQPANELEASVTPVLAESVLRESATPSLWMDAWRRYRRNRAAVASLWIVIAIVIASLIGPSLVHLYNGFEYDTLGLDNRLANPTRLHPFGTDTLGRD